MNTLKKLLVATAVAALIISSSLAKGISWNCYLGFLYYNVCQLPKLHWPQCVNQPWMSLGIIAANAFVMVCSNSSWVRAARDRKNSFTKDCPVFNPWEIRQIGEHLYCINHQDWRWTANSACNNSRVFSLCRASWHFSWLLQVSLRSVALKLRTPTTQFPVMPISCLQMEATVTLAGA